MANEYRVYICIDDTDNIGTLGTGHLAQSIKDTMEERGWGKSSYISRHQLYVHEDVPYTSHNSAMCFAFDTEQQLLAQIKEYVIERLLSDSAEGSDPGFCLAEERVLRCAPELIGWGRRAKCSVLTKDEAYSLAQKCGVHLSEHGGTGQGIVGALAGVGLRLFGTDGRVKGKLMGLEPGESYSAAELLRRGKFDFTLDVRTGKRLAEEQMLLVPDGVVKAVYYDRAAAIPAVCEDGVYRVLATSECKAF